MPYAPGSLTASCVGNATATKTFKSAKAAASIVLTADRPSITAGAIFKTYGSRFALIRAY